MSSNIVGEARVRITPESSGFEGQLRSSVTGSVGRVARAAAGALVAGGLLRTAADLIGQSGRLQTSLRESVGLLGQTGRAADKTFGAFRQDVAALSRELGVAQTTLSEGLYEALGAGVPRGNAIDFLRIASKAAIAGTTDVDTAVDGLTTVINAFGLKMTDAQRVSDSLFQTVNAGKARFDELASSLFNVAPVAAAANVSIETVGAALATLTSNGVPAAEATTQLRAIIQSLVAPSVRAEKLIGPVFKKAGFESGQAALKALGLQKALGLVVDSAGGSTTKLARLLGRVEAVNAAFTLTGKGAGMFTEQLKAQQNAAGVTDRALAQIERSAGRSFQRASNAARNFGLSLADAAAPGVARLADALEDGLNRVTSGTGFQAGVARVSNEIADALLDPQTLSTLQTFGATAATTFGAVRDAAQAAAPAVRLVAEAFSAVAASPIGPQLILTAAAFGAVGRVVRPLAASFVALRTAQAASTAATVAGAASATRFAGVASGLGRGLLALSGGPVGAATLGVAALAAGALLLSQRQSNAAQQAAVFAGALRDQASAADAAAQALGRVRDNTANLAQGRVAADQARQQVSTLRGQIRTTSATPAADLGGEAAKTQQLTALKNQLRVAEINLGTVQKQNATAARRAVTDIQAQASANQTAVERARALAAASGVQAQAQARAALATGLNRDAAFRYATGLGQTVRAQARAAAGAQAVAAAARNQARIVDTSTTAGKRQAAALQAEAREAARTATVQRGNAIATAQRAIAANKAIIASQKTTQAEKTAAAERIKIQEGLVGKVRAAAKKAGDASGQGMVGGLKSKTGEIRAAGKAAGEAGAKGAEATAPAANAAGQVVGTNIGTGLITGMQSQQGAAYAAGFALGKAGADGAAAGAQTKSPSRLTMQTGRDIARGVQVGIQSEHGRTRLSAAAAMRNAIVAAGAAGVNNARTQGRLIAKAVGDGFRVTGPTIKATITTAVSAALRESIQTARTNLEGFAQQLGDLAGQAIDAARPDFTGRSSALDARGAALDAASNADEERRLRNAVSLAEAGRAAAQKRYAAALAAQQRLTPEQDARLDPLARERRRQRLEELRLAAEDPARQARIDLERFLLQQDQNRLDAEQTAAERQTEIQKQALNQQLNDLVANLNAKAISYDAFNDQVNQILASNGVNVGAIGAQLGTAFATQFNTALRSVRMQGLNVSIAPMLPAGFLAGIERPAQVALQEAVAARNVLRQSFAAELARVRQSQVAQRQALQATFQKESSAGGSRIVASEQRQLNAAAKRHGEQIKELRALQRAFLQNPPQEAVTVIVNPPPGSDPASIGEAVARRMSGRTARRATR